MTPSCNSLCTDLMKGKVEKQAAERKIDNALTEIVELLNDLTWNLKPLGLDNQDEESTDTDDDESDESGLLDPTKVFQRQQQMALLGMDASTFTMVPKTHQLGSSSSIFNPISSDELDRVRDLLEKQMQQSKGGKFDATTQAEVCLWVISKLLTYLRFKRSQAR